jgi:hypothetical protein
MKRILSGVMGLLLVMATPAVAQVAATPSVAPEVQVLQRRFHFQSMEVNLENAVRQGAQEVASRAQGVMPIGLLFMGMPKARGFPLENFGVTFYVEVPEIRESSILLNQFTRSPAAVPQTGTQVVNNATTTRATGVVADDPMARSPITGDPFLADPNQFYRDTVKLKLVDAMLDYSKPLDVGAGDWLSVVARGAEDPNPASLYNDSKALILRIKGSDLALFYTGKITRADARKLVIESQF